MKYFNHITDAEELKKEYRKLCKIYHPDKGGSVEIMQEINNEFAAKMEFYISGKDASSYGEGRFYKTPEEEIIAEAKIREAVEKIAHIDDLEIEIIGAWVWVSGDTKPHKEILKEAGYKWMNKKKMWAFVGKRSNGRGNTSMEEMREKYGSQRVYTASRRLQATA